MEKVIIITKTNIRKMLILQNRHYICLNTSSLYDVSNNVIQKLTPNFVKILHIKLLSKRIKFSFKITVFKKTLN